MNDEQFNNEKSIGVSLYFLSKLLESKIITQSEYSKIKAILSEKYKDTITSFISKNELIKKQ